jgi:hypothetical protein
MRSEQKWLMVGIGVGVLGLVVAILGLLIPGLVLVVIGVGLLAMLGIGYRSPRAVKEGERTLYEDEKEDPYGEPDQPEDPNDRFVSVAIAREDDEGDDPDGDEGAGREERRPDGHDD